MPYYAWKKYNVITKTTYDIEWSDSAERFVYEEGDSETFGSSYNLSSSGWITLSGSVRDIPYEDITNRLSGEYFNCTGSSIYEVSSVADLAAATYVFGYEGSVVSSTTSSKGSLIGTVTSTSSSQYPNNGIQNGYWYVYEGQVYAPSSPSTITVPENIFGGDKSTISWSSSTDSDNDVSGYILERKWDTDSWTQIYKGSARTFTDSIPNNQYKTVTYRVKAYDNLGLESSYTISNTKNIINNTAPSTPGSITIPSTILADKSFQVSWGASTDTEGNLTGYKLERSINSGSTWQQVYQGPATSFTDTVPNGTPSVTYRVKAYDSYNAESGYKKSNTVGVINNHPPESPASITIPELILGGQPSLIRWGASNDEDQNLVGYELERQLNNTGGFTRIYKGSELQYTDTVDKGTLQVQYRVRAYDSYNAYSEYTTSSLKEVNNNTLPTITGEDTDLGTLESVSYKYTVTDPDEGQTLNVTEYIDDKVHKTLEVTSGAENTLTIDGEEFLQVSKGSHTIVISVDDGQGVLVKRTLTFTRVQTKLSTTLITPLPANEMPTRMYAFVFGNIPTEAVFHFYACNNAFDEEPTWQEVTDEVLMKKKFYFTNKTKTADQWGVNIKFEVDRSSVPDDTEIYISKVTGGFDGYSTQS